MKQGKIYTKLILWLFLAAVVCYFGYYIWGAVYAPLTTVTAIAYEAGAGSYTTGFVVREETLVTSQYDITNQVVAEGERVAKGQTLATGYLNESAQGRQSQIAKLEDQLTQLEYAVGYSADAADQAALDSEIQLELESMAGLLARRDMNTVQDRTPVLKGLVLRRMSTGSNDEAIDLQVRDLKAQLADLRSASQADTKSVTAVTNGYFSGTVDGYERVLDPALLQEITVQDFQLLKPKDTPEGTLGKVISGDTWYYATVVPADQVEGVEVGDKVPVTFSSEFHDGLPMTVVRLSPAEQGKRLLVLSCDAYMQEVTLLRRQSADVVFSSYSGLRVPKEAIRVDENKQAGVYVLEAGAAAWKRVEILHDNGESYVVKLDKSSINNLWPGDEILVGGVGLYDGKVVG